jgi:WD40 repeat protein
MMRHGDYVSCVSLARGFLVSGGHDKKVNVWSLAGDGVCVATAEHGQWVEDVAIASGGRIISIGSEQEDEEAREARSDGDESWDEHLIVWQPAGASSGDRMVGYR